MLKEWMIGEELRKFIQGERDIWMTQGGNQEYGKKEMENKGGQRRRMGKQCARGPGPSRAVVPRRKEGSFSNLIIRSYTTSNHYY